MRPGSGFRCRASVSLILVLALCSSGPVGTVWADRLPALTRSVVVNSNIAASVWVLDDGAMAYSDVHTPVEMQFAFRDVNDVKKIILRRLGYEPAVIYVKSQDTSIRRVLEKRNNFIVSPEASVHLAADLAAQEAVRLVEARIQNEDQVPLADAPCEIIQVVFTARPGSRSIEVRAEVSLESKRLKATNFEPTEDRSALLRVQAQEIVNLGILDTVVFLGEVLRPVQEIRSIEVRVTFFGPVATVVGQRLPMEVKREIRSGDGLISYTYRDLIDHNVVRLQLDKDVMTFRLSKEEALRPEKLEEKLVESAVRSSDHD